MIDKKDFTVRLNEGRIRRLEYLIPVLKRDYEGLPQTSTECRDIMKDHIAQLTTEYECRMALRMSGYRPEGQR